MNRKNTLICAGAAVAGAAAVVAVAAALPADAASGAKALTQHFDAKASSAPLMTTKKSFVLTDNDVTKGKTIGHDVLSCTNTTTGSTCHVAFAQKGGLLYASFTLSGRTGALKGSVNHGTGDFVHAKGTLTGQVMSRTDVKIALHYTK